MHNNKPNKINSKKISKFRKGLIYIFKTIQMLLGTITLIYYMKFLSELISCMKQRIIINIINNTLIIIINN